MPLSCQYDKQQTLWILFRNLRFPAILVAYGICPFCGDPGHAFVGIQATGKLTFYHHPRR
jgi:hypothetical protein